MTRLRWVIAAARCLALVELLGCSSSNEEQAARPTSNGESGTTSNEASEIAGAASGGDLASAGAAGTSNAAGAGGSAASCSPPQVTTAMPTSDVLTNLDNDTMVTGFSPGGGWYSNKDMEPTGMLSPDNTLLGMGRGIAMPGANGSAGAMHVQGSGFSPDTKGQNYGGGVGFFLASPQYTPGDLSGAKGIKFFAKSGNAGDLSDIKVAVSTTATDPNFCICNLQGCYDTHSVVFPQVPSEWTALTVRWSDLTQSGWGYLADFDPKQVLSIMFVSNGPLPAFDFWVDEVSLVH